MVAQDQLSTILRDEEGVPIWEVLEQTAFHRIQGTISSFCEFMRRLRVPDEAVLVPPASGWPNINRESFIGLGKNDCVIEVLRHMTFMDKYGYDAYEILPNTGLTNWSGVTEVPANSKIAEAIFTCSEPIEWECDDDDYGNEYVLGDVIGLTRGGRDTGLILLNCRYGIVYWDDVKCNNRWKELGYDCHLERLLPRNEDTDAHLPDRTIWMVQDFFELVKRKFLLMNQLPLADYTLLEDSSGQEMDALRDIYKRHGWPRIFRKQECVEAIKSEIQPGMFA